MSTSYNFRKTTRPTGAANVAPPRRRHATTGTGRRRSASASLPSASRGLLLAARLRRAAAARHAGDGSAGDHGVLRTVARHRAAPHCSSLTARHAFLRSAHHRHERRLEKRGSPPSPRARAPGELPLAAHGPFGPHRGVHERYSTKHEADRLPLARALSPQTGATPHAARRFLGGLRRRRFLGANFRTPSLLGGSGGAMASSNGKRGGAGRTHARTAGEAGDDAGFRASRRAGFQAVSRRLRMLPRCRFRRGFGREWRPGCGRAGRRRIAPSPPLYPRPQRVFLRLDFTNQIFPDFSPLDITTHHHDGLRCVGAHRAPEVPDTPGDNSVAAEGESPELPPLLETVCATLAFARPKMPVFFFGLLRLFGRLSDDHLGRDGVGLGGGMLGKRVVHTAVRTGCAAGVFGFVLHFGKTVFTVLAGLHLAEHHFFSIF